MMTAKLGYWKIRGVRNMHGRLILYATRALLECCMPLHVSLHVLASGMTYML